MKKNITLALAAVTIVFMSFDVMSPDGKPVVTGSPSESTCNQNGCHNSFLINTGGGSVTIASSTLTNWSYAPGQSYTISVTVAKTGQKLFGLGFEALTSAGANAGTFTAGTGTKTLTATVPGTSTSRTNIVHTGSGNTGTGTHTFTFTWKAPATNVGNITFYCAGNAANASQDEKGDYIYTTSQVVTPLVTGINEEDLAKQISIYPNPATDQLQILNTVNQLEAMTVSIIDMKGALISNRENVRSNEAIELSNMNSGLYSLRIETAGKVTVKPFIKQ